MDSVITLSSESDCAIVISSDCEYPVDTLDYLEDASESDDDISSVSCTSGPDAIVISEEDRTYDASDEDTSSDSEATGHTQSSE